MALRALRAPRAAEVRQAEGHPEAGDVRVPSAFQAPKARQAEVQPVSNEATRALRGAEVAAVEHPDDAVDGRRA